MRPLPRRGMCSGAPGGNRKIRERIVAKMPREELPKSLTSTGSTAGIPSMGAMSKPKKSANKPRPGKKPPKPAPPAQAKRRKPEIPPSGEAQAVSLFMPSSHEERAKLARSRPLTAAVLEELLREDKGLAIKLIELQQSPLIYEADLAQLLRRNEVRQLVLTQTKDGWEAQVLPIWKGDFLTLVSLKKEKRRYKDLDRLISTITMHGPLPPTILIGE